MFALFLLSHKSYNLFSRTLWCKYNVAKVVIIFAFEIDFFLISIFKRLHHCRRHGNALQCNNFFISCSENCLLSASSTAFSIAQTSYFIIDGIPWTLRTFHKTIYTSAFVYISVCVCINFLMNIFVFTFFSQRYYSWCVFQIKMHFIGRKKHMFLLHKLAYFMNMYRLSDLQPS